MILDPELIPFEIKEHIEAAANDLGKGAVWLVEGAEPANDQDNVLMMSQAFQRALTALAMMIL